MAANQARKISRPLRVTAVAAPYSRMPPRSESSNRAGCTISSYPNRQGSRDYQYHNDEPATASLSSWHGIDRCNGPVIRRPHLQRGSHGDRGEPEPIAVTNVAR